MELTREVFGNIPTLSKILFYLLGAVACGIFAYGMYRHVRLWRIGRRGLRRPGRERIVGFFREVFGQRRVVRRPLAGWAHFGLFWGFLILFIGTLLLMGEHVAVMISRALSFHRGLYYAVYEVVLDTAGIALLVACVVLAYRRWKRPPSLGHNWGDWVILASLFVIGVTGYVIEGLRILWAGTPLPGLSYVGYGIALLIGNDVPEATLRNVHYWLWWLHGLMALALVAAFPYTRLFHSIAGTLNIAAEPVRLGTMRPVSLEEVEQTGRVGAGSVTDLTQGSLLQLDACMECSRCQDACPAYASGKPLSPRAVVQDVKGLLRTVGPALAKKGPPADAEETPIEGPQLHGDTIPAETLWACTSCSACVEVCPVRIDPLGMILDMRRFLVAEGQLSGTPATSLRRMENSGNPWGLPADQRMEWAEGLDVPTVRERPDFEILYWVGCAAAYDRRVRKVARAFVRLMNAAGVRFAVLGTEERCTGDSARRIGEEFTFQELATTNIETLNRYKVRKIVTHCPHCLNALKQDFPQFGGDYDVVHHSQLLAELLRQGRLPLAADGAANGKPHKRVTMHDPCYLARVHEVVAAPREVLRSGLANGDSLVEMPRSGRNTFCCGAGGGRMWLEEAPNQRVGNLRAQEALGTGADTVCVGCPFCMTMMTDSMAQAGAEARVLDIAELLAERLPEASAVQETSQA
jgi:Fe-S oxidoreductase/nitrate reductase gamma subunit